MDQQKFGHVKTTRIWAIAGVHGEADRLIALHDALAGVIQPGDGVVYLGNYFGYGQSIRATIDELIAFRRWLLARPFAFVGDVVHLRGQQEEMWSKLLQLQFAPNPTEVLVWLLDHGVRATLESYGGDATLGMSAARDGAVAITKWTGGLRAAIAVADGHTPFMSSLRRAAFNRNFTTLFVHAGIDPSRSIDDQRDAFWWDTAGFERLSERYLTFECVVRGFDPAHAGIVETPYTISVDGGCGFGGSLHALCFAANGQVDQILTV